MGTWINLANTENRREVFGDKKTITDVGQMIPGGILNWCYHTAVDMEDRIVLHIRIPRVFAVAEHGLNH